MSSLRIQDIGPVYRRFRLKSGVRLRTVAARTRMDKTHICRYERGGAGITPDVLDILSKAIGCRSEAVLLDWLQTRYPRLRKGKAGRLMKELIREIQA